jgi:hypothetical protein
VRIRLSVWPLNARVGSAVGEACVGRFAIGGKEAAAVCTGDRGRPELEGGCICNRV